MRALLLALLTLPMTLLPLPAAADSGATPLFATSVIDTDNTPLALETLRGKPLVVNFWARWCGPCRKEIPDLVEMDAKYRSKGLLILGLAIEDAEYREAVRDFAKAYGVDYRVLLASVGKGVELMKALGNDKAGLPFTVVIDRNGKIVSRKLGAMSKAEMEAAIKQVL